MCCFVILLLSNKMQMSVRRFSTIPHRRASYCPSSLRPMQCTLRSLSPLNVFETCPLITGSRGVTFVRKNYPSYILPCKIHNLVILINKFAQCILCESNLNSITIAKYYIYVASKNGEDYFLDAFLAILRNKILIETSKAKLLSSCKYT